MSLPDFKLWQLFAGLGVPGVALGILWVLFEPVGNLLEDQPLLILPYMLIIGAIVLYALHNFPPGRAGNDFSVRVIGLNPDDAVVDNLKVTSTLGGESKKVQGGVEFSISKAKVPADGNLTLFAEDEEAGLVGSKDAVLEKEEIKPVTIRLDYAKGLKVSGSVRDTNKKPIPRATIAYSDGEATADDLGNFEFPAASDGRKFISVHVSMDGYEPISQRMLVSAGPIIITLRKQGG